ncbi:unnamed protein product [Tuber melanosporum]|uniref:(Perigord truffle) hypothetical protein n=1 Tax=Tuber melanosporum (strain Mel28) TaxID=656061 RepID=D5G4I6_TUBMM|nr:uncharacterized protein GSTUM_00004120001 [Tuber melanosporum]CAZ79429.1 unnamed protein product [Tuber melanosporum]
MSQRQHYSQLPNRGEGANPPQSPGAFTSGGQWRPQPQSQSQAPAPVVSRDAYNPLMSPHPGGGPQRLEGGDTNNGNNDNNNSSFNIGSTHWANLPPVFPIGGNIPYPQRPAGCWRGQPQQAPSAAPPTPQSQAGFRGFRSPPPAPSSPISIQPPQPRSTSPRPFSQSNITLAVDVSGSTAGRILRTEVEFMSSIIQQILRPDQQNARILPWNHQAEAPCAPTGLRSLESCGGTNPVSLLLSRPHLAALRSSGVWFLLTDGDISEWEVRRFSTCLAQERMHGVPVVVVVFGSTDGSMPAQCNISVGLSPFAAVPHSALLYQDVQLHGRCYVLAAKGCFEGLSTAGGEAVVLGDYTTWSDLPTIHPGTAFRDLVIPPPLELSSEEIALSDGLRVNFSTLFDTDLSDAQVTELLGNQNHLQSILLNAQAQGQSGSARSWLQRNQTPAFGSPPPAAGGMTDGQAAQSVQQLTQALRGTSVGGGSGGSGANVDVLRAQLREAHRRNSSQYQQQPQRRQQQFQPQQQQQQPYIPPSAVRSSRDATIEAALESLTRSTRSGFSSSTLTSASPIPSTPGPSSVYLPALLPPRQPTPPAALDTTGAFLGECSLCFESNTLLSILFKRPTTQAPSPPQPLLFPLALGSAPHNDVVSSWMCCYDCSTLLVAQRETPLREPATATLPLASWTRNSALWRSVLHSALSAPNTLPSPLLPVLFLAVLENCLEKTWSAQDGSEENRQRRAALIFARDIVLREVKVAGDEHKGPIGAWVTDVLLRPKKGEDSLAWKYPMEGFVLMTKLARTHDKTLSQQEITKVVWRKILHTAASRYATAVNRGDGTEEVRKGRIRKYLLEGISLAKGGEEGWMDGLRKLGFLGSGDLLALAMIPGEVRWIESVAGEAMAKWIGWLGELRGVMGGGAKECIAEIRRRWGREVEEVVNGIDWEGEIL